jgi:hypothetical protein
MKRTSFQVERPASAGTGLSNTSGRRHPRPTGDELGVACPILAEARAHIACGSGRMKR